MPDAQRAALSLIALEDFSYEQAAKVQGIPLGTLMSRLARGREALRQMTRGDLQGAAAGDRRQAMSPPEMSEAELQAFVDGQLPAERCTAVLAYLGRHPDDLQRLADYARHKDAAPAPARGGRSGGRRSGHGASCSGRSRTA